MTKSAAPRPALTPNRQVRLASLDARLATLRMQQGYVGAMPPLVAAQLSALQSDIRSQLATRAMADSH